MANGPRVKVYTSKDRDWYEDMPYLLSDKTPFNTGQLYTDTKAAKIYCKKCLSDKLFVGVDEYYTAIMCPSCGWEECIHNG